jgi:hypothetical protein
MPAEPAPLLDLRRRPPPALVVVACATAVVCGVLGGWLTRSLDSAPQPGWILPLAVSAAIAGLVAYLALRGSRLAVAADGTAVFSLHGRANLAFDLRDLAGLRPVARGAVTGLGADLPIERVRFLHRSGISPEQMRRWRADLACDLVLEGFTTDDAAAITAVRGQLPAPAGGDRA